MKSIFITLAVLILSIFCVYQGLAWANAGQNDYQNGKMQLNFKYPTNWSKPITSDDNSCYIYSNTCDVSFNLSPGVNGQNYILGVRVSKLNQIADSEDVCACSTLKDYLKWDYLRNYKDNAVGNDNQTTIGGNKTAWQMEVINNDNGYKTFVTWAINDNIGYRFLYSGPNDKNFGIYLTDFKNLLDSVKFVPANATSTAITQSKVPSFLSNENDIEENTSKTTILPQPPISKFYADDSETLTNSTNAEGSNASDFPGAKIVLLSQKLKKGSFGYNDIVGQVKNVGISDATYVRIDLTSYDENGDVIGTDYVYTTADTLKPNQKSSFDLSSSKDNFKGMKYYELALQWRDSDGTDQYVENAQIQNDKKTIPAK